MASLSRTGPALTLLPKPRKSQHIAHQTRCFTVTSRRRAEMRQPRIDLSKMMPAQRNAQSRMKNLKRSEIPDDIGLLPSTFVRPTYAEGPSLFGAEWKKRVKMDYVYLKQMSTDTLSMLWQRLFPGKRSVNGKVPLDKKQRLEVATQLHKRLYSAIARGDQATIEQVALSGLAQQQIGRIQRRHLTNNNNSTTNESQGQKWSCQYRGTTFAQRLYWVLQPLVPFKSVKIVSDRMADMPFGGIQMRQFIVRIRSRQTLDKNDGSAVEPVQKELTEYMVIQRVAVNGKPEEWKVWGTTKPSTYSDAVELESLNKSDSQRGSVMDKFKERVAGMGGNM